MFQQLNLQFKIGLSIALLLIISSATIIYLTFIQANKLKENAAKHQLDLAFNITDKELSSFFDPVENNIMMIHEWGKAGLFDNRSAENISLKLSPLLEKMKPVSFISIVNSKEPVLIIKKDSSISFSKVFENMNDTVSVESQIASLFNEEFIIDSLFWSSVRSFYEIKGTGISPNIKWISPFNNKKYMVSFGIDILSVADFLDNIEVGNKGRVIYFEPGGRIFKPKEETHPSGYVSDTTYLKNPDKETNGIDKAALLKWESLTSLVSQKFSFKYNGDTWWAVMSPMDKRGYGLWVGVFIPEKELLEFMDGTKGLLILSFLGILILAVIATSLILFNNFRKKKPLSANLQDLNNESAILQLIAKGESEKLEFKSTVRMNLFAGKPGKEIEIAWLKGVVAFLNTEGGMILIGITDSGEVHGLESDNFANDDKSLLHIQNLIKQHIGLEFSAYINFDIRTLKTKKILIIECLPANLPVFLKTTDKEQFFVRSGPSSLELPISKALKYIDDRKD